MKKVLPLLAVLLVLAAVVFFTWRRAGGLGQKFPAGRAAELAPADALFFLQAPDLERTAARWGKCEIHALTQEPGWPEAEWSKFVEEWVHRQFPEMGEGDLAMRLLPELVRIKAGGAFLATTGFDGERRPRQVGGFSYQGRRSEVEQTLRAWKEQLFAVWPGARSELSTHHGVEIESIASVTAPDPKQPAAAVHFALRDDWLFFATERALLEDTLGRYLGKAGLAKSLAEDPAFAEAHAQAVAEPDFVRWGRGEAESRTLLEGWCPVMVPPANGNAQSANPLRAVHHSFRLDGAVRDRVYLQLARSPGTAPLKLGALAVAGPDASGFAALQAGAFRDWWPAFAFWQSGYGTTPDDPARQTIPALDDEEFLAAFTPEMSFIFPKQDKTDRRRFTVALEVRDPGKARRMVEKFTAREDGLTVSAEGGIERWDWPPRLDDRISHPIVMTKHRVLLVSSPSVLRETTALSNPGSATLDANPAFAAAMQGVAPPDGGLLFLDPKDFVRGDPVEVAGPERQYHSFGFPRAALVKYLQPGIVMVRTASAGWLVESRFNPISHYFVTRLHQ